MSITYEYLNGSKQILHTYGREACFYHANGHLRNHETAVYFRYKLTNITVSNEMMRDYLTFLNSTRVLYKLNVEEIIKKKAYTFRITRQNSLKSFATLTAIRYLEEETNAIKFILKNKDAKTISKLKLLLLSAIYQMNGGHFLNRPPIRNEDFIKHKIVKVKFTPDTKIISTGLHAYFGSYQSTWGSNPQQKKSLCEHYKIKPL